MKSLLFKNARIALCLVCLSPAYSQPAQVEKKAAIYGTITNGTTGLAAEPDEIALMRPGQGMQILQTIRPAHSSFRFDPVTVGQGPLLIRATFMHETYIQVVPPVERAYSAPQKVLIYETGAKPQDLIVTAGLQVVKRKDSLHVSRVFAIENRSNPPRAFLGSGLKIVIPKDAENTTSQLQHTGSMPLPGVVGSDGLLTRGIRPGNAELALEYDVPGYVLEERAHEFPGSNSGHTFLVVVFQPPDAIPIVEGAKTEKVEIPNLGSALKLDFADGAAKLDFSAGGYIVENPMKADVNAIFDEPWKMAVALVLTILILFLGTSVIAASGISIVQRKPNSGN